MSRICQIFIIVMTIIIGAFVVPQQASAGWNEQQQGIFDDGVFIGHVAICIELDGRAESNYILMKFAEHIKALYIQKYGVAYVNSTKFSSPMSSGLAVGGAEQKRLRTRNCDRVLDAMQQFSKVTGFDIKAAYEEAQSQ